MIEIIIQFGNTNLIPLLSISKMTMCMIIVLYLYDFHTWLCVTYFVNKHCQVRIRSLSCWPIHSPDPVNQNVWKKLIQIQEYLCKSLFFFIYWSSKYIFKQHWNKDPRQHIHAQQWYQFYHTKYQYRQKCT